MGPQCNKYARERSEKAISSHLWLMWSCVKKERERKRKRGARECEEGRKRDGKGRGSECRQGREGKGRGRRRQAEPQAASLSAWLSASTELLSKAWERHGFQAF